MPSIGSVVIVIIASVIYLPLCLMAWAFTGLRDASEEFIRTLSRMMKI